jgi:hypothetical protein
VAEDRFQLQAFVNMVMNFWSLQEQVFLDQLSYRHFKEDSASRNSYSCMRTVRGERT